MLYTALKLTLRKKGFQLVVVSASSSPVSTICNLHPSVIITDITSAGSFNFIEEAKRKDLPVIVITKNGQENLLQIAFEKGADDYVIMPISIAEIALRVCILTRAKLKAVA